MSWLRAIWRFLFVRRCNRCRVDLETDDYAVVRSDLSFEYLCWDCYHRSFWYGEERS